MVKMMTNTKNFNIEYNFSVDIVIPIRDRDEYDVIKRLRSRKHYNMPSNFNIFIVDYGSKEDIGVQIKSICDEEGYEYYYANTRDRLFNLSHARNIAILNSKADYLIYEDIDLVSHVNFYVWINQQIQSMLIDRNWPFLVIPVAYISEEYSETLYNKVSTNIYDSILSEIYDSESKIIEFYAAASSHIVCSRKISKLIGGFDESFEGWGFEDSDFEVRLLRKVNIEKPRDFYKLDTRPYSNQTQWSGWRVIFRIFADVIANKGIYSFHIWHPKPDHRSPAIRERNHKIFIQNSNRYAKTKNEIIPLYNNTEPSDLFLNENPHHFNISVFHYFDNPILINEDDVLLSKVSELVKEHNIRNVIVNNPYGKNKRLNLYHAFLEAGVKVYIVERGALPNSIYIDPNGFCAESNSYQESNWIEKYDEQKIKQTNNYINIYKTEALALEPQNNTIGGKNLKFKIFNSLKEVKVLFIALQSPSDTTTNFFCDEIGSYENYINEMQKLCYLLKDSNWKIVYKNHPLTIDKVVFDDAICVDDYHINDILEACDRVSLINSGVGVLAMIYNKPVYYFGKAFYATNGLNKKMHDADELYNELSENEFKYDYEKSIKFLSFLVNDFYSFATWERKERKHTDQAKMSISLDITYEVLRVDGQEFVFDNTPVINLKHSILFDRYRTEDYIFRNNIKQTKPNSKSQEPQKKFIDIGLITKKVESIDNIENNKLLKKRYTLKSKTKKLVKDPNQFFVDYFLKRIKK